MFLLCSLSLSYDHLITTLFYGKETIVFKSVKEALLSYSKKKKIVDIGQSQTKGLVINKKNGNNNSYKHEQSKSRDKNYHKGRGRSSLRPRKFNRHRV